ncbi:AzlD domain-containing protein [Psychromonas ossibalaenae]|uniref:AzlD domain-containing protein n=1 Tax=Psychromonas ossibalaenae TaxID=444922 RepID=UPI00037B2F7E|nr:AzlD domain-containing protein [Psychromonas ossibalaenae]
MNIITIILLACITFSSRYLFLEPMLPLKIGPKIKSLLSFSAPAVLTAIWFPIVFIRDNSLTSSLTDPYLAAAAVAVIASYKTRSIYFTLGISLCVFALLQVFKSALMF